MVVITIIAAVILYPFIVALIYIAHTLSKESCENKAYRETGKVPEGVGHFGLRIEQVWGMA